LPWWMPDETSSKCCICETPFTFLTRRHHCRRCGRLVCATCSPHRITIPRQYIVAPRPEILLGAHKMLARSCNKYSRDREEDECPVCGTRQSPFGPGGAATDRERHVEECLSSHFAFYAGPSTGHASSPGADQAEHQLTSGTPTTPGILGAPSPSLRQRMLVYHATEKDCFDESGDPQECVICFEEFQPGDEMGRLECLCRFHRSCIRSWWSAKEPGSCPTHQLH
ncbi:hypothetical protein BDV97DRAFT_286388, partial [Delphinella strobiligena]